MSGIPPLTPPNALTFGIYLGQALGNTIELMQGIQAATIALQNLTVSANDQLVILNEIWSALSAQPAAIGLDFSGVVSTKANPPSRPGP
jgi:hypothetical protein